MRPDSIHPPRRTRRRTTWRGRLVLLCGGLLIAGVGLEILCRWQPIELYGPELSRFNPPNRPRSGPIDVLAVGDSFTAGLGSYVGRLRERLDGRRVVNSGVSGQTMTQVAAITRRRLRSFTPKVVIVQTYLGNDLWELSPRASPRQAGLARSLHWWIADRGLVGPWYLNYRSGQVWWRSYARWAQNGEPPPNTRPGSSRPFAVDTYSPRERRILRIDASYLRQQVNLEGRMGAVWPRFEAALVDIVERSLGSGAEVWIVAVPHCTQVSATYRQRFDRLGADVEGLDGLAPSPYVQRLELVADRYPTVGVLDPVHAFRAAEAKGQTLYYSDDQHLDDAGRDLLAELVHQAITRGHRIGSNRTLPRKRER